MRDMAWVISSFTLFPTTIKNSLKGSSQALELRVCVHAREEILVSILKGESGMGESSAAQGRQQGGLGPFAFMAQDYIFN